MKVMARSVQQRRRRNTKKMGATHRYKCFECTRTANSAAPSTSKPLIHADQSKDCDRPGGSESSQSFERVRVTSSVVRRARTRWMQAIDSTKIPKSQPLYWKCTWSTSTRPTFDIVSANSTNEAHSSADERLFILSALLAYLP